MKDLNSLNEKYRKLHPLDRFAELFKDFDAKEVLVTSSFGITSSLVLHMLSQTRSQHPVYFIDTSYHFEKTLEYKAMLTSLFDLKVVAVKPDAKKREWAEQQQLWKTNSDACCRIHKVEPLNRIKNQHKVWVSGLMGHQNEHRKDLAIFQEKNGLLKFHPLIDMPEEEARLYRMIYEIPDHPLLEEGYGSVGCRHCTVKGACRSGRWAGIGKTECGLHV